MRKSGILMPISSIPSKYGIGTFSKEAFAFVDFLERAGQKVWQILPLGPTGYGDSPYQSFSTFAGNPYYIDLENLIEEGFLTKEECEARDFGNHPEYVEYEKIYQARFEILRSAYNTAFSKYDFKKKKAYKKFLEENGYWLEDYALFMAVKKVFDGVCFLEWDEDIRLRKKEAIAKYKKDCADEVEFYKFQQYLFASQWKKLKKYANKKGVEIVGDIPIYVALDSADVWANPELFQLQKNGVPKAVAGCPPDAFCETGQLWGNPLYNWKYHKQTEYVWWIKRIAYCYELYDIVRIDHFRGFDAYWSIPYGDKTAENGKWVKGPGYGIFKTMKQVLGEKPVIAEDLGFLTKSVRRLVRKTGYPGMKVLQFAFDAQGESDYLPHNHVKNCVVYTGTHDNDTILGWYEGMKEEDKEFLKQYLNVQSEKEVCFRVIVGALSSVADTAIIPMQDYLALPSSARINMPSTLGDNWKWRMKKGSDTEELAEKIRKVTRVYGR